MAEEERRKEEISDQSELEIQMNVWVVNHLNEMLCRHDRDETDGADESKGDQEHQIARQGETRRIAPFVYCLWVSAEMIGVRYVI